MRSSPQSRHYRHGVAAAVLAGAMVVLTACGGSSGSSTDAGEHRGCHTVSVMA